MITLFYQSGFEIPNSVPVHLRSKNIAEYKSVKPRFITEICNYLNIQYRQVDRNTWHGETAYYHIELEWIDQAMIYRNVFACIDNDILSLIRDSESNLRILLWFPNEGFSLSMPRFIEIIDFCIKDLNIPEAKVYFVFGDINIESNFQRYREKLSLSKINVFGFDSFETSYHNECRMLESAGNKNMFPRDQDILSNLNKTRSKKFIFRNANPREHRLYFASALKYRNLLNQAFFSWLNRYYVPDKKNFNWVIKKYHSNLNDQLELKKHMQEFIDGSPYIIDHDSENIGDGLNQRFLQPQMFADSYFTFVTETTFDNLEGENVLFLTEKIYQPILQYHPFIVAACPGTLAYMRKYGYETFPELFDESYDLEQDLKKRTLMILDNIQRVCQMSTEQLHSIYYAEDFQKKLMHNKKLFVEGKGRSKWEEAIQWLDR